MLSTHKYYLYSIYIYIYIFIYLYYIKFAYVFSSTISGLLNFFLPIVNKRAIMQQVSVFCFVLFCSVSGFCVSFLLFLGWVFIRMYD